MTLGELKQPEITADGIQRFAWFHLRTTAQRTRRNGARLGPAFESRCSIILAQKLKFGISSRKGKYKNIGHSHPTIATLFRLEDTHDSVRRAA